MIAAPPQSLDRDLNAARNLAALAASVAQSCGETQRCLPVRLASSPNARRGAVRPGAVPGPHRRNGNPHPPVENAASATRQLLQPRGPTSVLQPRGSPECCAGQFDARQRHNLDLRAEPGVIREYSFDPGERCFIRDHNADPPGCPLQD